MRYNYIFQVFLCLAFTFSAIATSPALSEAKPRRITCGNYSYVVPDGFEPVFITENSKTFLSNFSIDYPSTPRESKQPLLVCVQEKKTKYNDYILPHKENIRVELTGPKRRQQMIISVTEDIGRNNIQMKFSILEEKPVSSREIREKHFYIPLIEIDAIDDANHTLLYMIDPRSGSDGFFDMEEHRSNLTTIAGEVLRSIRKLRP